MFNVRNLLPQTWYDVFLKMCSTSTPVSKILNVGTYLDVPGPVIDVTGQDNSGIFIKWKPPRNPNGVIDHYTLEWRNPRVNHSLMMVNVSSCKFQFPNTLNGDRFNVTIRAIGVTGTIGNPHYLDLKKAMLNNPIRSSIDDEDGSELWSNQNLPFVSCVVILLIAIIGTLMFGIYWNHRQCKKNKDEPKNLTGNVIVTNTGNGNLKSLVELHTLIQKNISDPPLVLMVPNYSVNSFYHLEEEETSEQISNESQRQLVIAAEEELKELSLTPEYHENSYFEPIHPHLLTHPVSTNGCVIMSSFYPLDVINNNNNNNKNNNNNNNDLSPNKENEENEQKNNLNAHNLSSISLQTDAIQHSWNFRSSHLEPNG